MFSFFRKKSLAGVKANLPRDEMIRRSRVLVIDDEEPELIKDLTAAGFSVDYLADVTPKEMNYVDHGRYDLILLDFGNVGKHFGKDEGLSLLQHIRRVNPSVVVVAYTSRFLGTEHADFYRQADLVLAKDAGIQDSTAKIEQGLRKAHSFDNLWRALLVVCDIAPGSSQDIEWQDLLVRGVDKQKYRDRLKAKVSEVLGSEAAQKLGMAILGRLAELISHAIVS
ncbi:MAG: hypothetical protein U1A77_24050 [Pirellulales bacterium]